MSCESINKTRAINPICYLMELKWPKAAQYCTYAQYTLCTIHAMHNTHYAQYMQCTVHIRLHNYIAFSDPPMTLLRRCVMTRIHLSGGKALTLQRHETETDRQQTPLTSRFPYHGSWLAWNMAGFRLEERRGIVERYSPRGTVSVRRQTLYAGYSRHICRVEEETRGARMAMRERGG